jgi:hypothetical protein
MGAAIIATPSTDPSSEMNIGRFLSGMICVMMVKAPALVPAAAVPVTARPTMNIGDVTEVATIKDPARKIATDIRNIFLTEKRRYSFPNAN